MKFFRFFFLINLFILISYNISFANIHVKEYIKVGILSNQESLTIGSDKKYYFISNNKKYHVSKGKIKIELKNNKAKISNKVFPLPIKFVSQKCFLVNDKIYRNNIIINSCSKGNNIINELKIEDYLKGILPKEANSSWNQETLKAQAIISRSYALKNIGKHSKEGYDVCSKVHCQVYGGASCETKNCNKAIYDTTGKVVTYENKIAQTLFHASCGGHTEDPKYVWQWNTKTPEYLKGQKDSYCKNSPHQNWKVSLSEKEIREKLIKSGYKVGKIKKISTSGITAGKAAKQIIIRHSKGKLKLNSYIFRCSINPDKIKSTLITSIKYRNKNFIFTGKGWGHKVGLCQWGAKVMGDKGFSYDKILKFYYPKTEITEVVYDNN